MVEIPVTWKVSVEGGEQLKNKFLELNSAFENNEKTAKEFAQGMRELGREAATLNNIGTVQNRIWLAANPGLNALNRSFSNFSHVANTTLSIMNAINLATIASTGNSTALAEQQLAEQEALRQLGIAIQRFGKDSQEAKDAEEKWRIEHEKTLNLVNQQQGQANEKLVTFGAALILIGGEIVQMIAKGPEFIKNMKEIGTAIKGLGATSLATSFAGAGGYILALLGPLAVFAAALYGVQYIMDTLFPESAKAARDKIKRYWGVSEEWAFLVQPFWNLYELLNYHIFPDMSRNFAMFVNQHIDLVNMLIDAINTIPKAIGLAGLDRIGHIPVPAGGGDADYIEWTKNNPNAMGMTGSDTDVLEWIKNNRAAGTSGSSRELLEQSKTANLLNTETKDRAKALEENWRNIATPTLIAIDTKAQKGNTTADNQLSQIITIGNMASLQVLGTQDIIKQLQAMNVTLTTTVRGGGSSPTSGLNAVFNPATGGIKPPGRAQGFDGVVTGPTMMLVGESGPERVTVGQPGGRGNTIIINNNIYGSVISKRDLFKEMDAYLKQTLKDVGFK